MQILAPEILDDARGLSMPLLGAVFAVGLALWVFGWVGHRFWIVLVATISAGVLGLYAGAAQGAQPWLSGILLAVAAGTLALAVVRVFAFAAGGLVGYWSWLQFGQAWNEPLAASLLGGLLGLVLFRYWTMALTSSFGTVLMGASGLCLADRWGKLDAVDFAGTRSTLLNGSLAAIAFAGFLVQFLMDRKRAQTYRRRSWFREEYDENYQHGEGWNRYRRVPRKVG